LVLTPEGCRKPDLTRFSLRLQDAGWGQILILFTGLAKVFLTAGSEDNFDLTVPRSVAFLQSHVKS